MTDTPDPAQHALLQARLEARLEALRAQLRAAGLTGFVIPRTDEHQNEYIAPAAERLAWASGFTGSAGMGLVTLEAAHIFTDGRYTLQVRSEAPAALYGHHDVAEPGLAGWLALHATADDRIGYDPWLMTPAELDELRRSLAPVGAALVPVERNPVDLAWTDRPAVPATPLLIQEDGHAGRAAAAKREQIAAALQAQRIDATVLTDPASVAWLLNLRGSDVPFTPLPLSFAVLRADGSVRLLVDPARASEAVRRHLGNEVAIEPPERLGAVLGELAGQRVRIDPARTPAWVVERLAEAKATLEPGPDPVALPRACKNEGEIAGAHAAHLRDAVALARCLHWLDETLPGGRVSELDVAAELLALRAGGEGFRGPSFPSIVGSGPNGAIVHYRASEASNRRISPVAGELLLLDSGAQYVDGTTDVTRTIAVGAPTAEQRRFFTLVLRGHIALARQRFPAGTIGPALDTVARMPLWDAGVDYAHGTGHGVGSFLAVHEGPQTISKKPSRQALLPGMIVSNEPGHYVTGAYGIRTEALMRVIDGARPGDRETMLGFEVLTLAPIDRRLIEPSLLTLPERAWLNLYHGMVADAVAPLCPPATAAWLRAACQPL